ncbi:hypothetical protein QJS83_05105 [Bdellovibrio sp. 22V]|uniref:hypothetical protein n=1 Tax=Bdellovibrio sp. 22V TaxID=3044166 RepID=UPI002543DC72|nr:hypothetical protein [Bdellovibrio sp. 22V]WII73245.1 hypothetical protein QJS83_05105 [Bdellovibrio sp. 22V]
MAFLFWAVVAQKPFEAGAQKGLPGIFVFWAGFLPYAAMSRDVESGFLVTFFSFSLNFFH